MPSVITSNPVVSEKKEESNSYSLKLVSQNESQHDKEEEVAKVDAENSLLDKIDFETSREESIKPI